MQEHTHIPAKPQETPIASSPVIKTEEQGHFNLAKLYSGILSEGYKARGELDLGEEYLTVQDDIFAQIGVIDDDGMRELFVQQQADIKNPAGDTHIVPEDHFVDLGSGVGNVCLWVYANTPAKAATGVEFIPSRHLRAIQAKEAAEAIYPATFGLSDPKRSLAFVNANLAAKGSAGTYALAKRVYANASVYFTHSWMFDDDLLNKVGDIVQNHSPNVRMLITSKRIPLIDAAIEAAAKAGEQPKLEYSGLVRCNADWNPEAPFHVYKRVKASE